MRRNPAPPFRAEPRRVGGPVHVRRARERRNEATLAERRLWRVLAGLRESHGLHFRRQVPIGPFIADFACHSMRVIVEADGACHEAARDARRDAWFAGAGYRTIRISNELIHHDRWNLGHVLTIELGL